MHTFQFTRPIRAAISRVHNTICLVISIHATHTGRDPRGRPFLNRYRISIHATHTGRDAISLLSSLPLRTFQFTRPIRAAIKWHNTRNVMQKISIHATHTGRDYDDYTHMTGQQVFQFTRPIRAAMLFAFHSSRMILYFNSRDPYGPRFTSRDSRKP